MMGVVNTNQVIGEQDGKCVIKEEINPEMVMVCKLPMRVVKKYANEHPEYVSLTGQLRSIVDEISKLQNQIWSRNSLVHRLSDCTDSFDLCMQKSA